MVLDANLLDLVMEHFRVVVLDFVHVDVLHVGLGLDFDEFEGGLFVGKAVLGELVLVLDLGPQSF